MLRLMGRGLSFADTVSAYSPKDAGHAIVAA
jgi:hypothetical protein